MVFLLLFIVSACIDPYPAPLLNNSSSFLVVDGFLNSSKNTAIVKLSRTIALSSDSSYPPETKATVSIEDNVGNKYSLIEKENGMYEGAGMNLNNSNKYQLRIRTTAGFEYKSEFIELKQSPSLDSVNWKPEPTGIQIYANAHDDQAKTKFYQWVYTETWEYNSAFFSSYKMVKGNAVPRPKSEDIYVCWSIEKSSKILISSTVRLAEDVVRDFPLVFIERGSKKLSRKYSIQVQQRALTEQAYNYWQQLQKTTENLGGLFDPLPSQVTGNIYNVNDASEPVLGYFSGGSVQEKRIYIKFYDLPDYLLYLPATSCKLDSILLRNISNYPDSKLLVDAYGLTLTGYTSSANDCIDCRMAGGTTTKPDFWP